MNRLPTLFLSHGAPTLPLESGAVPIFLKQLGQTLPTPKAILVISAHWETKSPIVSAAPHPRTIHDFSGFPAELYQMQYPAPGAPQLADRVAALLTDAGMQCEVSIDQGLDHGAWTPLILMYPEANIPVTQLSDWLTDAIVAGKTEALLHYRELAPFANHPTDEHLLPLFVTMGAGGTDATATQLHSSFSYGVLSMAAYAFS